MQSRNIALFSAVLFLAFAWGTAWAGPAAPNPVPEPSSLALLGVAVGGAAWAKFRRRKK
jgi:hypothetical protein